MISVSLPYALTSRAARPETGCNALGAFRRSSETDAYHTVIRNSLLKLTAMWSSLRYDHGFNTEG